MAVNPYESGAQKNIPAVLIYAFYKNHILMLHRNKKVGDFHAGFWNGLGGKLEKGESYLDAVHREFLEESGIDAPLDIFEWMGTIRFPNFKPHKNEDWDCAIFKIYLNSVFENNFPPLPEMDEGTLKWIETSKVMSLNLWPGDHLFLPHVLSDQKFCGTIWYEESKVVTYHIDFLKT